ncbi:MAG: hypothetical protein N3E45_08580 [Oscillatoriaceae bacterium SKW80]|nr:hypothetical protein [Oscillatoriaceae bacterium SKYG93]MCX8120874.1 hypothetical protein [Oscillatoriaceae bacterium SKW80]MDW8452147.1 hypothetical protein [Oscillatoriaceae cyanobacterium SKYGB_i_bin93]
MLKYYLERNGKIPTSVHPFVKQEKIKKVQQQQVEEIKFVARIRKAFLGILRSLFSLS